MTYDSFLDKFSEENRTNHYYFSFEDPPGPLKEDIIEIPIVEDFLTI
jgi:jumonji domain-containing protein 7